MKKWFDQSQRAFGLILTGKKAHHECKPESFCPPFDVGVKYMHDHPEWVKEDIFLDCPNNEWEVAIHSVQGLNGTATSINWARDLDKMRVLYEVGEKLERTGHKMKMGDSPDILHLVSDLRTMEVEDETGLVLASEVDLTGVKNLQLSGWKEYDEVFGGMPVSGPLVVFATTKTGKSFWASKFTKEFLKFYPERQAGYFTLEMPKKRYLKRAFDMYPDMKDVSDRLWVTSKASTTKDIMAMTATRKLDFIVIDGIAQAIVGRKSADALDEAWSDIERMGRLLEIPILVLAQPNRNSKFNTQTQFIGKYDIEWSGAAENASEQLLALQYVGDEMNITGDDCIFPVLKDAYYMIMYFQRDDDRLGALILDKHVETHLGRRLWESKPHGLEKDGVITPTLWKASKYAVKNSQPSTRVA